MVPLTEVASGGEESVTIARPGPCTTCGGTGARPGTSPEPCQACGGSGQRATTSRQGNIVIQHVTTCAACAGRGTVIHDPCADCAGHGTVTHHDRVTVQIPPGIEDGTALRVPGRGLASPAPGGQAGDAYVVVHTAQDPRFRRRGADLWRTESLSVPDAVLGTRRLVPTIDRDVPLTIPPGSQPGDVLRIPGHGLPHADRPGRGDLLVTLAVHVPDHPTDQERRLYQQLRALHPTG